MQLHLYIPLQLGAHCLKRGTFEFNSLKTFIALKFISAGHLKRNKQNIEAVSRLLGYSQKTIEAHISSLISSGYIRYNKQSGTLFLVGLNKVCDSLQLDSKKAIAIKSDQIKYLKELLFSGNVLFKLKAHRSFVKSDPELSKQFPEPLQAGKRSNRGNMVLMAKGYQDYAGVSCDIARRFVDHSRMWSSRMKLRCKVVGIMEYNGVYKELATSPTPFNLAGLSQSFPLEFSRGSIQFIDGQYLFLERLADAITTDCVVVRKKRYN